jgi:diacylglycerol kinase (ATP)
MKESPKEQEAFSIVKRAKSFSHAFRGIKVLVMTQHNAWVHVFFMLLAVVLGFYFCISLYEWLSLIIVIGMVLTAEAFNTAMEFDMDLTSPEYHPFARDTKDVAAGAVLISATTAFVVGLVIFIPKIISCLGLI